MALDEFKTKGALKSGKPGAGGGVTYDHPMIGIVKDNIDPTRSGKIRVQLEGNTNNESNNGGGWVTVQYLSTYFGMVKPTAGQSGNGDYVSNPSAYGQWQSPPDIGTKVLCIFAEGDPNRGYYVGCVVEPEAMQMVPAIGSSDNVIPNEGEAQGLAGAPRLPVTSINTNNKTVADSTNYLDAAKPVHSYTASIMSQQGVIRDPIRGPISSSASREAVSRVGWGVATPGRPIMEGGYNDENLPNNLDAKNQEQLKVTARRGGHSIVMDDGDIIGRDQLIRIRTALGHQITMSDDGQTLVILHSNGQSYVELGKEGTVDIFSTNSFNVRTQGDINFHADQHINLHATENMNIQAKNLHINTEEDFKMRAGKKLQLYSVEDFTVKSMGGAAIDASGQASLASSSTTFINGSKVNLNTGKSSIKPEKVPIITLITQTDTLHDEQKGFIAAPGKLLTVTTRTPAHYPWSNAGQGVNVKSTLDASKALPVTPSSGIQKANQAGAATGAKPPAIATAASAPDTKTISKSLDKTVTNTVMGSVATSAATGPAKAAVTQGAAIVGTPGTGTKSVAVGAYAQSPTQLVNAGVLKPGSDRLINGLAQQPGAALDNIMSKNLFSGVPGAVDLKTFAADTSAQTIAMIDNMQKAQTTLSKVGLVTGKEAPIQLAGLVTAGSTAGLQPTIDAVKNMANTATTTVKNISGTISGSVTGAVDTITNAGAQISGGLGKASTALAAIGAGGAAASLATKLGSLGGISSAVKGLSGKLGGLFGGGGDGPSFTDLVEQAKGPAAAAFTGIRDSLKPLQAGVPQNLSSIAKASVAKAAGIASESSGIPGANKLGLKLSVSDLKELVDNNTIAGITGATKQVSKQLGNIEDQVTSQAIKLANQLDETNIEEALNNISDAVNNMSGIVGAAPAIAKGDMKELANAASSVQSGGSAAKAASLASGINNLPGGLKSAASVLNKAEGAINSIPGTELLGNVVKDVQTTALNGINTVKNVTGTIDNVLGGALSKEGGLTNLISSALPLGKAAGLLAGLSALGGGGAAKTKAPTIGFNTFDRTTLQTQVENLLGNPKIPIPNLLGDIKESVISQTEQLIQKNKDNFKVFDELEKYEEMIQTARDQLYKAEADLPQGDPKIKFEQGILNALLKDPEYLKLKKKAEELGTATDDVKSLMDNVGKTTDNMLNKVNLSKTASTVQASAMEALQQTNTDTALKSTKDKGTTALAILQAEAQLADQDINNSISSIMGGTG